MKSLVYSFLFLLTTVLFSQQNETVSSPSNRLYDNSYLNGAFNSFSNGKMIVNSHSKALGTPYLFKKWKYKNYIHLVNNSNDSKIVKLKTINYNVELGKFVTKVKDNKVLYFDQNYFDYVIINNRRFELVNDYTTNTKKVAEIIGMINNKKLIKIYTFYILKSQTSGYQALSPKDKMKFKSKYYIYDDSTFLNIRIKKKTILPFISHDVSKVLTFAKKNHFSFNNEKDLIKILHFYNSL